MVAGLIQKKKLLHYCLICWLEDSDYEKRFDIDLLASRLIETTEWLMNHDEAKGLSIGYFGASTERPQRCGQRPILVIL
jgi:hypothetical protein